MVELSIDEISDIEECLYSLESSSLVRLNEDMLEEKLEKLIPNNVLDRWDIRLLAKRGQNSINILRNIVNKYYDGKENEIKHQAQKNIVKRNIILILHQKILVLGVMTIYMNIFL